MQNTFIESNDLLTEKLQQCFFLEIKGCNHYSQENFVYPFLLKNLLSRHSVETKEGFQY